MGRSFPVTEVTDNRPTVPLWLPDETLFSLCSRTHVLTGNALDRTTCLSLFGHPQQGSQHDLPARVDHFTRATGLRLGSSLDVISNHTVLGYYLPFRSPQCATAAVASMAGDTVGTLKFSLGLLTSRFRAHHPLKSCPNCREEDRTHHHVPYWHLTHQLPGVWICPRHGELLQESRVKSTGVGRFHWLLPGAASWRPPLATSDPALYKSLRALATSAMSLRHSVPGVLLNQMALRGTYLEALEQAGLAKGGRVQHAAAGVALVDHFRDLRRLEELRALPATRDQAQAMLTRLVSPSRCLTHPLWHLAAVELLFGQWSEFLKTYTRHASASPKSSAHVSPPPAGCTAHDHPARASALIMLRQGNASCRSVAHSIGVDTGTVMAWAASAGIALRRRPKQLKAAKRTALVRALRGGADKRTAAARHQVSVQSVTRLLRTEPGLQAAWHAARHARAQADARRTWSAAMRKSTGGAKALRAMAPAAYAWLYRNDRVWLQGQIATIPKTTAGNHACTDWKQRDAELSRLVSQAIENLGPRATLQQVYQSIPVLKAKLGRLKQLPLTQALLAPLRRQPASPP